METADEVYLTALGTDNQYPLSDQSMDDQLLAMILSDVPLSLEPNASADHSYAPANSSYVPELYIKESHNDPKAPVADTTKVEPHRVFFRIVTKNFELAFFFNSNSISKIQIQIFFL